MFVAFNLEQRIPEDHPLRPIKVWCDRALAGMSRHGRGSCPNGQSSCRQEGSFGVADQVTASSPAARWPGSWTTVRTWSRASGGIG